jgi:hypothetical protein
MRKRDERGETLRVGEQREVDDSVFGHHVLHVMPGRGDTSAGRQPRNDRRNALPG